MFGILPMIGPMEIILILIIVLIIFGPGKLPQLGKSLGKAIKDFKGSVKEVEDVTKDEGKDEQEERNEKS